MLYGINIAWKNCWDCSVLQKVVIFIKNSDAREIFNVLDKINNDCAFNDNEVVRISEIISEKYELRVFNTVFSYATLCKDSQTVRFHNSKQI